MSETSPMVDPNQIITGVATELAKNAVSSFWDKVKKFFKDLDADKQIRYGEAYEKYLTNTRKKHSQMKTLIYRSAPKKLESFYECVDVKYGKKRIDTSKVDNLLEQSNKIVLTGTGGIGKSMLLKYLFLNTIEFTEYIPVLIELRSFNSISDKEINLLDYIYSVLKNNEFDLEKKYFEKSMQAGGYVIYLDGFDELSREKINIVGKEIQNMSDCFNKNHFVVSSRPMDRFIGWNDFCEMSVCPLTKQQAISLIQKIEYDDVVKQKFLQNLNDDLYTKYESFASNPLLLMIMLLTFSNHATIPERLNDFYEQAYSTLYNMHDATKDCYTRDIRTGLGYEEFKKIFSYICFISYFKAEYEFSESQLRGYIQKAKNRFDDINFTVENYQEDLILSVCMLVKDGINYRFSHRSFQEYFAALYTCKLMDNIQEEILTKWMEQSFSAYADEYLTMLFNIQSDKVNRLVLCPGIKKIKKLYDTVGFSLELLQSIYSEIWLRKNRNGQIRFGMTISNLYIDNIIKATCKLNEYRNIGSVYSEMQRKLNNNSALMNALETNVSRVGYRFDKDFNILTENEVLELFESEKQQILFCFEVLNRYSVAPVCHKKTLAEIMDEV